MLLLSLLLPGPGILLQLFTCYIGGKKGQEGKVKGCAAKVEFSRTIYHPGSCHIWASDE